jgi:LPXTG-motif cell wall-anchored protein
MGLIIGLLVIWLILSIVGFAVKGLIWLAIIGLVLFVATGVWGWVKRKSNA